MYTYFTVGFEIFVGVNSVVYETYRMHVEMVCKNELYHSTYPLATSLGRQVE